MINENEWHHFIQQYATPVFIVNVVDGSVIFSNNKAEQLYNLTEGSSNLGAILKDEKAIDRKKVQATMRETTSYSCYDIYTITAENKLQLADIQADYFNEERTKAFVEIKLKQDVRMEMAQSQVNQSFKAEAILEYDHSFSFFYCNDIFSNFLNVLNPSHITKDGLGLADILQENEKERVVESIKGKLDDGKNYCHDLEITTTNGEQKWVKVYLQRRELDATGEKVMCSLVCIDVYKEQEEELGILNQYLSTMQETTEDIIYRVVLESNTMYHYNDMLKIGSAENEIEDYANTLTGENIVHPVDKQAYLKGLDDFYNQDKQMDSPVRFSLHGKDYEWYKISRKKIYDKDGEVREIFGVLKNVDNEVQMKEEVSTLTTYFEAFQSVSTESFSVIDLKNGLLSQKGEIAVTLGLEEEYVSFPDTIFELIHPDDIKEFKVFHKRTLLGFVEQIQTRMKTVYGGYEWFEICCKGVSDEKGNVTELVGKASNIHYKKTMQEEVTTLNQYFRVLENITGESFYIVDVKNKILTQTGQVADEIGLFVRVTSFPESVFYKVHPEDLQTYKDFTYNSMKGVAGRTRVRIITEKREYLWYEIICDVIRDKHGDVTEVIGKMNNVHIEMTAQAEVTMLNKYFSTLQEFSEDILYRIDVTRKTLYHEYKNKGIVAIDSVVPNYMEFFIAEKIIHPEDIGIFVGQEKAWYQDESIVSDLRLKLSGDEYKWYSIKRRKVLDDNGNLIEILGTLVNIHRERTIQEEYTELNQYFNAMQNLSDDILFHIDLVKKVFTHSDKTAVNFGLTEKSSDFSEVFIDKGFIHPDDVDGYRQCVAELIKGESSNYQARCIVAEGVYNWFDIRCEFIWDDAGNPMEIFGRSRNIQREKDLELRATRDYLTKVHNRNSFEYHVNKALEQSAKEANHALVFIDLDDFKFVNDNYGHQFGDFVLEKFAQRINNCIRSSDFLGRVGGDEFVVYLKNVRTKEMAMERAATILDRLKKPIGNGVHSHKLGASLGIALVPEDGITYDELYANADKAVYQSKRSGKNVATVYSEDME